MKQKNLKLFLYSKWSLFTKLNAGVFRVWSGMHELIVYLFIRLLTQLSLAC